MDEEAMDEEAKNDLIGRLMQAVLDYVSPTGKGEMTFDDYHCRQKVREVLIAHIDEQP